jgi:hypothetical protein
MKKLLSLLVALLCMASALAAVVPPASELIPARETPGS